MAEKRVLKRWRIGVIGGKKTTYLETRISAYTADEAIKKALQEIDIEPAMRKRVVAREEI